MTETAITPESARALITSALQSLLNPGADIEELRRFFHEDYVQWVDGVSMDFAQFLQHARHLKSALVRGQARILQLICEGQRAADIHEVIADKKNGERIQSRVIAFFTFRDGKICAVEEMTHLISGAPEDRDLGSRR